MDWIPIATGALALAILPLLLLLVGRFRQALGLDAEPAAAVAGFYTLFNILGVVVMWPLTNTLVAVLGRRFRTREEDERVRKFEGKVLSFVDIAAVDIEGTSPEAAAEGLADVQYHYGQLKDALLLSGTEGRVPVGELVAHLDRLSNVRRMAEQLERGARYLWALRALAAGADNALEPSPSDTPNGVPTA